jgi:hypothetical protein
MSERKDPRTQPTVHETAVRMQAYYAQTGAYRTQDVSRVLGDPRKQVSHRVVPSDQKETQNNLCITPIHSFHKVG